MKIIKRGVLPQEKTYEAECSVCKSIFSFTQADGEVTFDQREGTFITVKCPVCGQDVYKDI